MLCCVLGINKQTRVAQPKCMYYLSDTLLRRMTQLMEKLISTLECSMSHPVGHKRDSMGHGGTDLNLRGNFVYSIKKASFL